MTVSGVVTSVQNFGAFVDIGGIQALLPVSEMAWGRVEDAKALYSPGDKVEAIIINLDWENNRITLSSKDTLPDPWNDVVRKYTEGSVHERQGIPPDGFRRFHYIGRRGGWSFAYFQAGARQED